MNTFRMLASPRVWGPILGVVVVLALIFYAYLAAVASPQENLKDLPIALVNEDRGADLAGEDVNLGDRLSRMSRIRTRRQQAQSIGCVLTPAARR
jgi:uncharacterized phage infection (PIP) family protein YhgE